MMPAPPNEHLLCTCFLWLRTAASDIEITRQHRRPPSHIWHCIESFAILGQTSTNSSLARLSRIWVASASASALSRQAEAEVDSGKSQEEQPLVFGSRQRCVQTFLDCFSNLSSDRLPQNPTTTHHSHCLQESEPNDRDDSAASGIRAMGVR